MGALLLLAFLFLANRSKGQELITGFEMLSDRAPDVVCFTTWPDASSRKKDIGYLLQDRQV